MHHLARPNNIRRLEGVRNGQVVDTFVVVQPRVTLARVQAAGERGGELADQAVVGYAEVAQFEGEADEVGDAKGVRLVSVFVWGIGGLTDKSGAWIRPSIKTAR